MIAVCGTKNTGKSSFGRLLANCCLNWAAQVAWLDTDPGQPEFTVPGDMIALRWLPALSAMDCRVLLHTGRYYFAFMWAAVFTCLTATNTQLWWCCMSSRFISATALQAACGPASNCAIDLTYAACLRAGLVSLTLLDRPVCGLPHMHRRQPASARFVGHLSAERDPVAYVGAVQSLLAWHARQQGGAKHRAPLIVNTPGWIKVLLFILAVLPALPAILEYAPAQGASKPCCNLESGRSSKIVARRCRMDFVSDLKCAIWSCRVWGWMCWGTCCEAPCRTMW